MYLDDKLVFLAGSTGSVGTNLTDYILRKFPSTRIRAAYFQTEPFIKHARIEYVKGDLRLLDDCKRMVRGCDCAIMAASRSAAARDLISQPWKYLNDNVIMNVQIFEAFHSEKVKRVIYLGTSAVYQEFEGHIKENELDMNKESHPSYFGVTWAARFVEKLCRFWHEKTGMEIIITRAANIFGPYAKFNSATTYFVPALIKKAVEKMDPFEVWGSPEVTRDVIFSEDFAAAVTLMLNSDNIKFDIFNVGSGIKTTVGDVANWSLKYAGHKPSKINYDLSKPTTIKFRALDISKAKKILDWQPKFSTEEGIKKTVEWWIKNRETWKK